MEISIRNLWFKYPFSQKWVIKNLNLVISGNTIIFIGPNGSGKTTLLKLIMGVEKPNRGTITFNGKKLEKNELNKLIFYVPVNVRNVLVGPTVLDDFKKAVKNGLNHFNERTLYNFLEKWNLTKLLSRKILHLSEGERRIVAIVSSILSRKKIIVMDEPTIGLDKFYRTVVTRMIKENLDKSLFIMASNDPRFVVEFDNIAFLNDGKIIFHGETREVLYSMLDDVKYSQFVNQIVKFVNESKIILEEKPVSPIELAQILKKKMKEG